MDFFAQNIREFRQKRCLSQEYMALTLGIHTSNYSRLESGIYQARIARIMEISKILQVQPYELFIDKTLRKRLEEATLNEMRLQQLELELSTFRKIFAAMPESFQFIHGSACITSGVSANRNFVS
jgi:transcriptional regulator with XRE-family HTH domain